MIALLTGTVRSLTADKAVLEVSGVGYLLSIHQRTSSHLALGTHVTLHTSLVVREDSMTLFGFFSDEEREVFELLQTVSGIGPKVALAISGALTPHELMTAIAAEDIARIEKVPGIGRKGVQRLILELKGKIAHFGDGEIQLPPSRMREQLLNALIGLGFSARESDSAIAATFAYYVEQGKDPEQLDSAELLKRALQSGKQ